MDIDLHDKKDTENKGVLTAERDTKYKAAPALMATMSPIVSRSFWEWVVWKRLVAVHSAREHSIAINMGGGVQLKSAEWKI